VDVLDLEETTRSEALYLFCYFDSDMTVTTWIRKEKKHLKQQKKNNNNDA